MDIKEVESLTSKFAFKYHNKCMCEMDDLKQDLILEYYRLEAKRAFVEKKLDDSFNEKAYVSRALENRCNNIQRSRIRMTDHEIFCLDDEEDFLYKYSPELSYIDDFSFSKDSISEALKDLDEESRRYVVTVGYLRANLDFLKKEFEEMTRDCSKEDVAKVKTNPTDKNISLYIFHAPPHKARYVRSKLKKNQKFIKILKNC